MWYVIVALVFLVIGGVLSRLYANKVIAVAENAEVKAKAELDVLKRRFSLK